MEEQETPVDCHSGPITMETGVDCHSGPITMETGVEGSGGGDFVSQQRLFQTHPETDPGSELLSSSPTPCTCTAVMSSPVTASWSSLKWNPPSLNTPTNCTAQQSQLTTSTNCFLEQSVLTTETDCTVAQSPLAMSTNHTSERSLLASASSCTPGPSSLTSSPCCPGPSSCTLAVSHLATATPPRCPPETSPLTTVSSCPLQPQVQFIIVEQQDKPLQCERMVIVTGQSEGREVFVIPSNQLSGSQLLFPGSQMLDISTSPAGPVTMVTEANSNSSSVSVAKMTVQLPTSTSQDIFTTTPKPLPAKTPNWAQRLHNAEKIGESYRGYCTTESELEAILVLHKQQTGCVFGTRQSPCPVKPATRLMWRSQYVPYDGIPFVNAGSRAIVMECQYGPRRKGLQPKKNTEHTPTDYKTTCPARIYIKKVRKFPEFCVPMEPTVDRKTVRQEQEKAFSSLRSQPLDTGGALRYYMQLPTEKAHLYHDVDTPIPPPPPDLPPPLQEQQEEEEEGEGGEEAVMEDGSLIPSRLHPRVAERIKELVAQGHQQVYSVRKQLRHFVEREMFKSEGVPERHNLCYFPTVNDIKNHIHEAQRALGLTGWTGVCSDPLSETVTLTLTPATSEVVLEGSDTLSPEAVQLFSSLSSLQPKMFAQLQGAQPHPVTSLSHPSTQEPPLPSPLPQPLTPDSSTSPGLLDLVNPLSSPSPTLSPPQLIVSSSGQLKLSHSSSSPSLHVSPQASPSQSLHSSPSLHVSPQASPSLHVSPQASPSLHVSPQASPSLHVSPQASPSLHVSPQASPSQSLPVSPTSFLHTSSPLGESLGIASPQTVLGVGQMVSVSAPEDGGTHQIILEDGQTIPVQIVDPSTIALTSPNVLQVEVKEEEEDEAREEEEDGIKVEEDDSVS